MQSCRKDTTATGGDFSVRHFPFRELTPPWPTAAVAEDVLPTLSVLGIDARICVLANRAASEKQT
jgi:hypothetical protein